jgi:DNA-binding NarL/FixJ family response regulator
MHKIDPIHILIVEDDENYRESMKDLINGSDRLVCEHAVESCEAAIMIIQKDYLPEVILLDIQLPGISGIEGIKKIHNLSPATHIIMLTIFDDDEKVFNAICQGAVGYLLKSSPVEKIQEAVEQVVKGGAAMSPSIAAKVLKMFTQYSQPKQEYGLSQREKEILRLLIYGNNKKQIADQLFISFSTVHTHLKNIYSKLHVHSQIDVVAKALKEHLI